MADNAQKTPIARSLEAFGHRKVLGVLAQVGKALPASVVSRVGQIVTVKFEITTTPNSPYTLPPITVPLVGSQYVRLPIQPGELGMVMTADAYLGGMTGLGGGTADLSRHANLSCLVWTPLANKNWTPAIDDDSLELIGPNGVILHNNAKTAILKVTTAECSWTPPPGIPIQLNGNVVLNGNLQINGSIQNLTGGTYAGDLKTSGNVIAGVGTGDQVGLKTHTHGGVSTGSGTSGAPTPGS